MTDDIKRLTPYQHVRHRTEMYFGSRVLHTQTIFEIVDNKPVIKEVSWVPALYTALREIIDNALDEILGHGFGNKIQINYDPKTFVMSVEDNGRGIPIDEHPDANIPKATMVLSEIMSGRNFGDRGETVGVNGIGASGVNFCSEFFEVEIHRDGKIFKQKFTEGDIVFGDALQIFDPKVTSTKSEKTGTLVRFRLSPKVFSDLTLPEEFVYSRVYEIALANPNLRVYYNGNLVNAKGSIQKNLFPQHNAIEINIEEDGFRSKFLLIPDWLESGDHIHTMVNNIPVFNGGVHVETFKKYFFSGLLTSLERESKKRSLIPNRSDITERLLIYNVTNMKAPSFDSQSKTRLINDEVANVIKKTLEDSGLYKRIIKQYSEWIESIYQRCSDRTLKKDQADIKKESKRILRNKVPSLMDANGKDRSKCILFLAEGLSAISGMSSVRDPQIHGGLGLSGKVLNVNGENPKDVLNNQALRNIMNSLGLIIGSKATLNNLRYGAVYIAHDMDPDGLNIGALLINFFHTFWPELFDPKNKPFIYIFSTPFIIASKGKDRKYWYAHNYQEFDPDKWKGWTITRAKGLATLEKEDWKHSLTNPQLYPVVNDGKMKETLDLIFNPKRADDRKVWIGLNETN